MPKLLTTSATLLCPHGGRGTSVPAHPLLMVDTGIALVDGDQGTIAGCASLPPCTSYTLHSMALNATEIDGQRAILDTDFQITDTLLPLTRVETGPTEDATVSAQVPAGQDRAPTPPALLDLDAPTVSPAALAAAFVIHTGQPATIPWVFTLSAAFPLRWRLTLLNSVQQTSTDATNGVAGLVVAPSGGQWASPVQVLSLTLTAAFMSSLGVGPHRLYVTAVSRRGQFGLAMGTITVAP